MRMGGRYGLATMCIGGGQGIAATVERTWPRAGASMRLTQRKTGRFRGPFSSPCRAGRTRRDGCAPAYSLAALRSSSARSVFSQEKAVAVCFLPAPST